MLYVQNKISFFVVWPTRRPTAFVFFKKGLIAQEGLLAEEGI